MHFSKGERYYYTTSVILFYIKTNILQDFYICISVLLSDFDKNAREISFFSKWGREGDGKRKQNAGEILERREIW